MCLLLTRWTRTTSSSNAVYQDADASAALSYVGSAGWQGGGGMQWVTHSTCRRQGSARSLHHISFLFFLCLIPWVNQCQTAYWGMEQPLWTLAEDVVTSHSKQIARNRKQARDSWSSPACSHLWWAHISLFLDQHPLVEHRSDESEGGSYQKQHTKSG